ncbi:MAG: ABC transporter ATP-binding protein [Bacilli bacterium]
MMDIIEVSNISKEFKRNIKPKGLKAAFISLVKPQFETKQALNNISFKIKKGEIVGFIGANGAGKSTTIKMMCGILLPSSGQIKVDGIIPYDNRIENAKKIGVVFGQRSQLVWDIALEESFTMQKYLYEINDVDYQKRLAYFIEKLELQELLRVPIRVMSLGQKMRCELACAFLHNPSIVYLDEPTIGLDVKVKQVIREFILEMNELYQTTIILTTHDMQDIQAVVNRVMIIDNGQMLYDGQLSSLTKAFGNIKRLTLQVDNPNDFKIDDAIQSRIDTYQIKEDSIEISFSLDNISSQEIVSTLFKDNIINDFSINNETIEEIVKVIYTNKQVFK